MKKIFCGWGFWKYIVLFFSFAILIVFGIFFGRNNQFQTIDVIGGADGPTTIFISGNIYDTIISGVVIVSVVVGLLALCLFVIDKLRKRGLKSK